MTIKNLFDPAKDIYRTIEKVITYNVSQETRLRAEITEYIVTDSIEEQFEKHTGRIGTGELNRFLAELREAREPPSRNGRRLNLLYGTQVRSRPPRFRFFVNDPGLITRDYGYWVENRLRDRFELAGVPVAIDFVRRPQRGPSAKRTRGRGLGEPGSPSYP